MSGSRRKQTKMANFQTHITGSTLLGIGYGAVAHFYFDVSLGHSFVAAALCSVAGMLPDLDHKLGIPLREMLNFVAVLVPMLMMPRFMELGLVPEQLVFVTVVLYVLIRFVGGALFRKFTKHRGMWHSIPAAAAAGMVTYVICLSPEQEIRMMKSWAVVLGFLLHLVLDEIYSVDLIGRRLKKSSGTALKFFGKDAGPNLFAYANLIILGVFIASDGVVMDCCREAKADGVAHQHEDRHDDDHSYGFGDVLEKLGNRTRSWVSEAFKPPSVIQESQQPFMR